MRSVSKVTSMTPSDKKGRGWDIVLNKYGRRDIRWSPHYNQHSYTGISRDDDNQRIDTYRSIKNERPIVCISEEIASQCGGRIFTASTVPSLKFHNDQPRVYSVTAAHGTRTLWCAGQANHGIGILIGTRRVLSRTRALPKGSEYDALASLKGVYACNNGDEDNLIFVDIPGYPVSIATYQPGHEWEEYDEYDEYEEEIEYSDKEEWLINNERPTLSRRGINSGQRPCYDQQEVVESSYEVDFCMTNYYTLTTKHHADIDIKYLLSWLDATSKDKPHVRFMSCNYLHPNYTTHMVTALERLGPELEKHGYYVRTGVGGNPNYKYHDIGWVVVADKKGELSNA